MTRWQWSPFRRAPAWPCLSAAVEPSGRELFGPLVLFSPLYDFQKAWQTFHREMQIPPEGSPAWDDFIWVQCVIAWRNRAGLGLEPATTERLRGMFLRWVTQPVTLLFSPKDSLLEAKETYT